ncbi:ROK family protein [Parasphaerochaeta coccoides]|nr:ROK family transcriptional regulator [Parasphaerochaeta coccoides]
MRINNNFQKNANTSLVAQAIWRSPGISRVSIAKELSLYRSTVTNIIATLMEWGIVHEAEEGESMSRGGRRPIILRLNHDFGYVAGLDIQPSHYRAVLLDISGRVAWSDKGMITGIQSFDDIVTHLMDIILSEVEKLGRPLLAVCMGFPGIVDSKNGIITYAEPFKLMEFDVHDYFRQRYRIPVLTENDANCTAWLEMSEHRMENPCDFISIIADYHEGNHYFHDNSGIGVGIGLSIDGTVYHGGHSAAGEFCSLSWRKDSLGQTGLPSELLVRTGYDEEAWKIWFQDLFSSLVSVLAIFDPSVVFIHGKPFSDENKIRADLASLTPQFNAILEKIGCELKFNANDEYVVAKGAALMYLHKLFSVPMVSERDVRTHFDWDDVMTQARRNPKTYRK